MSQFLEEIRDYLLDQGILGATGGPVHYLGDLPPAPDYSIAILSAGGEAPETTMYLEQRRFSILVRGVPQDYVVAERLAQTIYQTLHCGSVAAGWVYCYATGSSPFFLGYDDSRRPMFSLNFRTLRKPDVLT